MIIIEAGLADRADPRVSDKGGKLLRRIVGRVMHIAGMDADAGMNCRARGDFKIRRHIVEASRQRHHAVDAGGERAIDQARHFVFRKAVRREMAVGVDGHGSAIQGPQKTTHFVEVLDAG